VSASVRQPCVSCPWRRDAHADAIPSFSLKLAEGLASTSPDERGMGPEAFAPHAECLVKVGPLLQCLSWHVAADHREPHHRMRTAYSRENDVPLVELDDDATLALKLLDAASEDVILMLPAGLDNAIRELEYRGLAKITEPCAGIPLTVITREGREQWLKRAGIEQVPEDTIRRYREGA
jgi:hypothetical protein